MIYLSEGAFKPALIFISLIFLPMSVGCLVLTFVDFRVELLIVSLLMILSYSLIVFGIYKFSKTKKYYLIKEDEYIVINYSNIDCLKIDVRNILEIEYYKISSVKAWFMLYNCIWPQCAFITYVNNEKKECKYIGNPNFDEIKRLCIDEGIALSIK